MPAVLRNTREVYDGVALPYVIVAGVVFAIVVLTLAFFLLRYRARPDREAAEQAEAPRLEIAYGIFLVLVVAGLLVITFTSQGRDEALGSSSGRPLRIGVVAAQWEWRFTYAGTPVVQEPRGKQAPTVLYVPVGRRILFSGRSQDVLHDFWIPDLRFQRQVWPNHTERWGMVFAHAGTYQGLCAWFCGLYHEAMHFDVRALPPGQFDAWLARRAKEPA